MLITCAFALKPMQSPTITNFLKIDRNHLNIHVTYENIGTYWNYRNHLLSVHEMSSACTDGFFCT